MPRHPPKGQAPSENFADAKRKAKATASDRKTPHQKRAEKAAERDSWTQEQMDAATLANGGTPKSHEDKHPGGRPSSYPGIDLDMVGKLCRLGMTNEQMAGFFDVSLATWYNYQRDHTEFLDAIQKGKASADDLVEQSLFQQAVGFSHPEDKIFYDNQIGQVVTVPTIKRYRGDTAAAFIWLKNRRPNAWKDRADPGNANPETTQASLNRIADALEARDG